MKALIRNDKKWMLFENPQQVLKAHTPAETAAVLDTVQRHSGWAAGFVSYEAAPVFDPKMQIRPDSGFPAALFALYEAPQILDELPPPESETEQPEWTPEISETRFAEAIGIIRDAIREGTTYQINFTYRLTAPLPASPYALFCRLFRNQPADYAAWLETEDFAVASVSPELFFTKQDNRITMRPMKGTAPRGHAETADRALHDELRNCPKNRAENLMITDMVRNDLGRIARNIRVPKLFETEQHPTVWQMTSTVEAETEATLPELFRALFPCASITGAPKISAMQIIRELEHSPRKIYTGSIGWVSPEKNACFNVAIRTALFDRQTGRAEYGVGGGIVWDSDAQAEYAETRHKSEVLFRQAPDFELLETMRTKNRSIVLLDRHLERLERSARYFGFTADTEKIRAALQNTAAGSEGVLRLTVTQSGSFHIENRPLPAASGTPVRLTFSPHPLNSADPFVHHKTTRRAHYNISAAKEKGADDLIFLNERGEVCETSICNLLIERDGHKYTPAAASGLLEGTLRGDLLNRGEIEEATLRPDDLRRADRLFVINSVRGIRPAVLLPE